MKNNNRTISKVVSSSGARVDDSFEGGHMLDYHNAWSIHFENSVDIKTLEHIVYPGLYKTCVILFNTLFSSEQIRV